jgi:hypothetical protein
MKEVELLKLGYIVHAVRQDKKNLIMVAFNGGPLFDYYISILTSQCDDYEYLKTDKSIIGGINLNLMNRKDLETFKCVPDDNPIVGKNFTVNNHYWSTSEVKKIINNNIIITKNSVYAIHDISELRDKKINDLGI